MATTTKERIYSLDLVRGVAVMGIVAMNIYGFGLPKSAYFNPTVWGGAGGIDLATFYVDYALFDGKMRGLFAMLFGASTLLVIERAMASEKSALFSHYSRMAWLFVFGMLHYWLLWWGDILAFYALCGVVLFLFRNRSAKALRNWGIGILTVTSLFALVQVMGLIAIFQNPSSIPADQMADLQETMGQLRRFFGADTQGVAAEIARMKGDYGSILEHRFIDERWKMLLFGLQGIPVTIGIMIVGMWLFRNGFLTAQWEKARYAKIAIWCLLIGGFGSTLLAIYQVQSGFAFNEILLAVTANGPLQLVSAIGWAALIIYLSKSVLDGELASRISAAGRMAFSNYIGTSLVLTTVFYGYGANLFAEIGRFELNAFVIGMAALMLLWSKPWLARFHYGPFEWVWRSLSRLQLQPMRKKVSA